MGMESKERSRKVKCDFSVAKNLITVWRCL